MVARKLNTTKLSLYGTGQEPDYRYRYNWIHVCKNYNMRVVPVQVVVIKRNNVTNNKNVEGTGTPGTSSK